MNRRTLYRLGALVALLPLGTACDSFDPQYVDSLGLQPDSAHLAPGESAEFRAIPFSQEDIELADRADRVEWQVQNSAVAEGSTEGGRLTVTARELGEATFSAALGRGEVSGRVYVHPAGLATIRVEPASVVGDRGTRPRIRAILEDAQGNPVSPEGHRISWESVDPSFVFVGGTSGLVSDLLLRRAGTTRVKLIVNDQTVSVPVTIR